MPYFPNTLPKDADPWLVREFQTISQALDEPTQVSAWDVLSQELAKPRDYQVVFYGDDWNPGYGAGPYYFRSGLWVPMFLAEAGLTESAVIACSDETSSLTTGTAKRTFRAPYAFTLIAARASVNTAPTGADLILDLNVNGSSIMSTRIYIDAGEKTSYTASTVSVIGSPAVAIDSELSIDIDQVGSTVAGAGLKVTLIWIRA